MWFAFSVSRLAAEIEGIAKSRDFSRRIGLTARGRLGDVVSQLNIILAEAEQRDRALRQKVEELTDARDDAQTLNQLQRRLKTEIKARSIERDAALRRAEAANEAKSQFLANMTHEIRTPMHGILGLADVLARTQLEPRQKSLVQTIARSGRGLLTIINDVLDFSKVESGRFDLMPRPFSLRVCIDDVVKPMLPRFERKGVEAIVRIDEKLPDLMVGDIGRIRQVLINLLENGLKFTAEGYVLLDVSGTVAGDAAELVFTVQDTGVGIARDKIRAIFEKFNQADNSSTRRHEGTGLGLAISRMLAERMDGSIEVSSTVGEGSTFVLKMALPIHQSLQLGPAGLAEGVNPLAAKTSPVPVPSDANIVALDGGRFKRARVLLVEDNIVNQEVASEYLGEMGCLVTLAVNGREAVEKFGGESFDLILMDCLMPELDGYQATRAIREIEKSSKQSHTPIVALTANAFEHDRQSCLQAGMDAFLSKPFNFEDLETLVRAWLPERMENDKPAMTGAYT